MGPLQPRPCTFPLPLPLPLDELVGGGLSGVCGDLLFRCVGLGLKYASLSMGVSFGALGAP